MDWITFNLLDVNKQSLSRLRQTTSLDTFEGATKNFHDDGLYSTRTFGPIGSDARYTQMSYIDVNVEIISPVIALTLFDLKRLYKDVMSGKRYAVWDPKTKDFEPASPGEPGAGTGYTFFIAKWSELTPKVTESRIRQKSIDVVDKFRDTALSRYVMVLPAGLRDMEIKPNKREQEDEINPMYRRLISTARTIPNLGNKNNPIVDAARWKLQATFIEIYQYLFNFLEGKKGFIRGKWARRKIHNGTRNVISSMDASCQVMGREDEIRPTDTVMGMYQGLKSILPVAIHAIRTKYLPISDAGNGSLYLIDKKTLRRSIMEVRSEDYDHFTTDEGVEKLISDFKSPAIRHKPIEVDGKYLALIWNNGTEFKIFHDIEDLPDGYDREFVEPLTYAELLYLSGYEKWNDYFTVVTRYPVAGDGSTYASTIRLMTTARSSMLWELDQDWITRMPTAAIDFPDRSFDEFVTSLAPHPSRIQGLVADFDGDTASADSIYTDEALAENRAMLKRKSYWINSTNQLTISLGVDTVERVLFNLLADPDQVKDNDVSTTQGVGLEKFNDSGSVSIDVNPTLYHISPVKLPSVLKPLLPAGSELASGKYPEFDLPRVCFSESIDGCLRAVYANYAGVFENGADEVTFYVYEAVDFDFSTGYCPFELKQQNLVHDAHITREYASVDDVKVELVSRISWKRPAGKMLQYRPYDEPNESLREHSPAKIDYTKIR